MQECKNFSLRQREDVSFSFTRKHHLTKFKTLKNIISAVNLHLAPRKKVATFTIWAKVLPADICGSVASFLSATLAANSSSTLRAFKTNSVV